MSQDPIIQAGQPKANLKRIAVEHDGYTYWLSGREDANIMGRALMMDVAERDNLLTHLGGVCQAEISAGILGQALMISEYLEHSSATKDNVGERGNYDISHIVGISVNSGPLFLKLAKATAELTGISEKDFVKETLDKSLGKSPDPTDSPVK